MTRKKIFGWIAGSVATLILLVLITGCFIVKGSGFHHYVLAKIVQQAEEATGGKVEIQNFDFHLSNLSANAYGLVIHGTEPDPAARCSLLIGSISISRLSPCSTTK